MNGITFFRLNSPYEGDVTKNCALTGNEVDNNFYTLEGRDIKSVKLVDRRIVITLLNGDVLSTDPIADETGIQDLSFSYDPVSGTLTIVKDGVVENIEGFVTEYKSETIQSVPVNGTLIGKGIVDSPLGINNSHKTGQYRPVISIIDTTNGEELPSCGNAFPGDRYLTIEKLNDYGYLYNYEGLKKLACHLTETGSPWRIPSKADWDDMLNAIELRDGDRNHEDARSNKYLGRYAGKFLKSKDYWRIVEGEDGDDCGCGTENDTCINYEADNVCLNDLMCQNHHNCSPTTCGEYGSCHHRTHGNNKGVDKYGFNALPAGYANENEDYLYFRERAYFWTSTNHDFRDAYIKALTYDRSSVLQDIIASDNYLSVRLVRDYNGHNYNEREDILGESYSTVLMPSVKNGQAIWTSQNIAIGNCDCHHNYILPNGGEGLNYSIKFFMNEWDGKCWQRKELEDGESVVVINGDKYDEYRAMNGELKNVATVIFDRVVEIFEPRVERIETDIENLQRELDEEIERSTTTDEAIQVDLEELKRRMTTAEGNIETNTQSIDEIRNDVSEFKEQTNQKIAELVARDEELQNEIDGFEEALDTERQERIAADNDILNELAEVSEDLAEERRERIDADNEISGKILTPEGTEFDTETGILSLKSADGTNDIQVQFNMNFGTF